MFSPFLSYVHMGPETWGYQMTIGHSKCGYPLKYPYCKISRVQIWNDVEYMYTLYWQAYSVTSDNGQSEKQTTSVERTNCLPLTDCSIQGITSDIGTTSLQWTSGLSPLCPLFGVSTVYREVYNVLCILVGMY